MTFTLHRMYLILWVVHMFHVYQKLPMFLIYIWCTWYDKKFIYYNCSECYHCSSRTWCTSVLNNVLITFLSNSLYSQIVSIVLDVTIVLKGPQLFLEGIWLICSSCTWCASVPHIIIRTRILSSLLTLVNMFLFIIPTWNLV